MAKHADPESYFAEHPDWMIQRFYQVRSIIRELVPRVNESMTYACPFFKYLGLFCFITYNKKNKRMVLGFCNGHLLSDEAGVLRADENQAYIRHWVLEEEKTLDESLLRVYIYEAVLIQETLYSSRKKQP